MIDAREDDPILKTIEKSPFFSLVRFLPFNHLLPQPTLDPFSSQPLMPGNERGRSPRGRLGHSYLPGYMARLLHVFYLLFLSFSLSSPGVLYVIPLFSLFLQLTECHVLCTI